MGLKSRIFLRRSSTTCARMDSGWFKSLTRGLVFALSTLSASKTTLAAEMIHLVSFEDPPYVFTQGKSKTGLVVRYVDELMWRSNLDYRLTIMPAKRALLYTLATPNTCVFPVERSQEREVQYAWVSPISISRHGFFKSETRNLPPIRVLNDVKQFRIGSSLGSAMGEYLASLDFQVDYAADNQANIHKLKANRIDLWASDTRSAKYIAHKKETTLSDAELIFFTTVRAIGCNPSLPSETISKLNKHLRTMYQDGTIDKISENFEKKL